METAQNEMLFKAVLEDTHVNLMKVKVTIPKGAADDSIHPCFLCCALITPLVSEVNQRQSDPAFFGMLFFHKLLKD